mgnify:CR=1 FL=1
MILEGIGRAVAEGSLKWGKVDGVTAVHATSPGEEPRQLQVASTFLRSFEFTFSVSQRLKEKINRQKTKN